MVNNFSRAFTFIELLVVMIVIGILASIAYPVYIGAQERAKVTKDMSNLRQIGLATQTYMNDNDGVFPGSTTDPINGRWMSQLELNRKYLSAWGVLQSPFDTRSPSELGDGTTPISYGINANVYVGGVAISADRISKPTVFILFAPAQTSDATVAFGGWATSGAPGVEVLGAMSTPGGNAIGGPQNNRSRINALFADLHSESMPWTTFICNTATPPCDTDGYLRWNPF
jgi:prepilin-type N-terminal cleavage/methylation domain-containing protein